MIIHFFKNVIINFNLIIIFQVNVVDNILILNIILNKLVQNRKFINTHNFCKCFNKNFIFFYILCNTNFIKNQIVQ